MYVLYKIDQARPMYLVRCCGYECRWDAIAEAEWCEEHGDGKFVVIEEEK